MTETTAITKPDLALAEYGSRTDIEVQADRFTVMLPGAEKLNRNQRLALAQYSIAVDANPYRGEVYAYTDSHGFHLVDGYKLLVRWAKRQCDYSETYRPLDDIPADAIGYRCFVLRADARAFFQDMLRSGATFDQALDLAATSAVGVVTKSDRTQRNGQPQDPPNGWTWDQVARKRALKNALNMSHGAPSPREIAAESWRLDDGTETIPDDWQNVTAEMLPAEREETARRNALARMHVDPLPPADANEAIEQLWG